MAELKRRMSHREFVEWGIFYRVFPFCDERTADRPAALIAASLSRSHGGDVEIDQLLPYPVQEPEGQEVDPREEALQLMDYLGSRKQPR